jgi:hypothetical protein
MAEAMTLISSQVLGSTAGNVTFNAIPQTYRDLRLVISGTTTTNAVDALVMRYNGDAGSNYSVVYATGDGSTASSGNQATTYLSAGVIGTSQSITNIDIMDYAQTDKHKTSIGRGNTPGWGTRMLAGRWASTSAITSVQIFTEASLLFSTSTTFKLFGIVG